MLARGDPDALAEWDLELRAFCASLREDRARVLSHLVLRLSESWSGEPYEKAKDGIVPPFDAVMEAALHFESLSVKLERYERTLRSYLDLAGSSSRTAEVPAPAGPSTSALGRSLTTRRGEPLQLLDPRTLDRGRIDWTSDDFVRDFWNQTHHGYTGADYMALVAVLPRVLQAVERDPANEGGFAPGSLERACYEAFFGDAVIRISDGPAGLLSIDNGRHRLFAALQQGVQIPVLWASSQPSGTFHRLEAPEDGPPRPPSHTAPPGTAEDEVAAPEDRAWMHRIPTTLARAFLTMTLTLVGEIVRLLQLGFDAEATRGEAGEAIKVGLEAIGEDTRPLAGPEEEVEIAALGAGGDSEIGQLVAEAMRHTGPDGEFHVAISTDGRTTLRAFEVRRFDSGLCSAHAEQNEAPVRVEIREPRVLVCEAAPSAGALAAALATSAIAPVPSSASLPANRNLVVVMGPVDAAIAPLENGPSFALVKVRPSVGQSVHEMLEGIAACTGGQVLGRSAGRPETALPSGSLGAARRFTATASHATFVVPTTPSPAGRTTPREDAAATDIAHTASEPTSSRGTVVGREAILYVGSRSHAEATERGIRAEAASHSLRSALAGGVVTSAVFALARASASISRRAAPERSRPGAVAVCRALEEPLRRAVAATGRNVDRVIEALRREGPRSSGVASADLPPEAVAHVEPARAVASAIAQAAALAGIPLPFPAQSCAREMPWPVEEIRRFAAASQEPSAPAPTSTTRRPSIYEPRPALLLERAGFRSLLRGEPAWPAFLSPEQQQEATSRGIPVAIECLVSGISLVLLPSGEYEMGGTPDDEDAEAVERPRHGVRIPACYAGIAPVTQEQWERVTGARPSRFRGRRRPVECVSWDDALDFLALVNSRRIGPGLRLPSESEWEYAARAGTTTRYWWGNDFRSGLANARGGPGETTAVGTYPPNGWGLYDALGNVWEWCADGWHGSYCGAPTDGRVWRTGDDATPVLRGGSWNSLPAQLRASQRERAPRPFAIEVRGLRCFCEIGISWA